MKITKITDLGKSVFAHVCPRCGAILADACEADMLPEFSICDCDRNPDKMATYELFEFDGIKYIQRNKFPRFVGVVNVGVVKKNGNIVIIKYVDEVTDPIIWARAIRKADEFLVKQHPELWKE